MWAQIFHFSIPYPVTDTASSEDPTELSFKKGEVLDILTKSDLWWEARKSDGTKGIAPSNYLKLTSPENSLTNVTDALPTEQTAKAEALYAYTASANDETELSFRKGEVLDILTQSDLWWEARKADGTIGIAPSNYLSLITTKSSLSLDEITLTEDIYPYRAQALHAYAASAEDSTELSFKKGEILEILTNSDLWWEARTANGKKGIAPSNYLELIGSESTSLDTTERSTLLDEYPYQAEALHACRSFYSLYNALLTR
ncbi:hypothetical protein BDZ94DRAFT_1054751 [Collybia nuda]|uniref:SH3 domain-containing protein n=1 Tax=Collybia nuda TaxID=64659 RepID=A0A9P6CB71_9AGAR|nr:hypothetical protein BDZ94DRAFT_1054751 [Collybia nuda]